MKVLITGAGGQVGRALLATAPARVAAMGLGRDALDITDIAAVADAMAAIAPDLVINAAAYTAVDRAESEPDQAYAINRDAVAVLADEAARASARLAHISTDFVFNGLRAIPYPPDAHSAPLGVYGRSKLAGEVAAGADALIVRTAWVYAAEGHNFVHTMLRLMRERGAVRVVADQIGTPTWATSLARAIWALALQEHTGIWHHTDSGVASWYDFAVAIAEEALALGLLDMMPAITPIRTLDYPTPAARPAFSVLDCTATGAALGAPAPHWRANLRAMLAEVKAHG